MPWRGYPADSSLTLLAAVTSSQRAWWPGPWRPSAADWRGIFGSFFGARLLVGLGEAALVPAAASLIIDLFAAERRGFALGVFSLGAVLGSGLALFVGGVLLRWIAAGYFEAWPIGKLAGWRPSRE